MGKAQDVDDLYQQGLLAIWLKGELDAPIHHQLATARERIIDARKRGKSVDGRLNPSSARAQHWAILSIDQLMYGVAARQKPVEDIVVDRITVQEILAVLTPPERDCLGLVYQGFTQPEIARRTGYSHRRIQRMMRSMREKVWVHLHGDGSRTVGPDSERRRYLETSQAATRKDAPWTDEEDAVLMELAHWRAHEVALFLGRTHYSVRHRRSRLLKKGKSQSEK